MPALLPFMFDAIKQVDKNSVVMVVSPLIALMKDHVTAFTSKGISAAYVSDKESDRGAKRRIKNGKYQLIFSSPEALFATLEWINALSF